MAPIRIEIEIQARQGQELLECLRTHTAKKKSSQRL